MNKGPTTVSDDVFYSHIVYSSQKYINDKQNPIVVEPLPLIFFYVILRRPSTVYRTVTNV